MSQEISRRQLLLGAAGAAGAAAVGRVPGAPSEPSAARSQYVHSALAPAAVTTGPSFSPLQDFTGTITPTDLHFQRHHNGIPQIDPAQHQLLIHGMVRKPLVFTVDEIKRFPSVTRIAFLECSGNGRAAYRAPRREMTPQDVAGLTGNTEWTGVPLKLLLEEAGVDEKTTWFLAEGADADRLGRSVPIEKAQDDALVVYAQNGEPLRPAYGFPLRLLLPGYEGNMNVKWLHRIKLGDQPWMTRDETSKYTDPLPNSTARQFSFMMDATSIITSPVYPNKLVRGWWPVSGLAWSGRGKITRVEVSTDNGSTWNEATLQEPVLSKAHARFVYMWEWKGERATLLSRATDETGYVQPTRKVFTEWRGTGTDYHFNYIKGWDVETDGSVFFAAGSL